VRGAVDLASGLGLGGTELATGAGFILGMAVSGLLLAVYLCARAARGAPRYGTLADGAVLLAEDGQVVAANPQAEAALGPAVGHALADILEGRLGEGSGAAREAVERLVRNGQPFRILARDAAGHAVELQGEPCGALARLVLRDAELVDAEIERQRRQAEAERAQASRSEAQSRDVAALMAGAPFAAWSRTADGVEWAAGGLATDAGVDLARPAAQAAAARRPGQAPDAGRERFRIELPAPPDAAAGPTQVLDVVEIAGPDDRRLGFAVDASTMLESERTLARFVRTMTETFAHLTVGLAIFDRNQMLVMFNPALVQMWHADPAWLATRPSLREIVDTMRASRRIPDMADFHAWRRRLTDLFKNTEAADYEELWHLADGSDIRVLARPHPHGSLAFVFDDVTERLRLEQQFRHLVDLRHATLDRLEEGLAVFGPDGLLQLVNAAFHTIWGTDAEAVRPSMHARDLLPLVRGMTVETDVWSRLMAFITGDATRQGWTARLTLGSGRILSARFAPLPGGSTMAVFGDVTDTERFAEALRERNAALEAAEEMRAAVLDRISHRLRTPLNTIFGFGQLLTDARLGTLGRDQARYSRGILESARHMLATVDEVTDLAALEVDPLRDPTEGIPLGETLMLTGRLLERRATEEGVGLLIVPPETDIFPSVDVGRLRQIVFGMMTDAIGRCRNGGTVELATRPGAGGAVEIFTRESPPRDTALDLGEAEAASLILPVIRRLLAREGGSFELTGGPGSGELSAICRFDTAAPPVRNAPVADTEAGETAG